jgi:hypothetical protein
MSFPSFQVSYPQYSQPKQYPLASTNFVEAFVKDNMNMLHAILKKTINTSFTGVQSDIVIATEENIQQNASLQAFLNGGYLQLMDANNPASGYVLTTKALGLFGLVTDTIAKITAVEETTAHNSSIVRLDMLPYVADLFYYLSAYNDDSILAANNNNVVSWIPLLSHGPLAFTYSPELSITTKITSVPYDNNGKCLKFDGGILFNEHFLADPTAVSDEGFRDKTFVVIFSPSQNSADLALNSPNQTCISFDNDGASTGFLVHCSNPANPGVADYAPALYVGHTNNIVALFTTGGSPVKLTAGAWYIAVISYVQNADKTAILAKAFLNGYSVTTIITAADIGAANYASIGAANAAPTTLAPYSTENFNGSILDIAMYNRGFTDTERQEIEGYFMTKYLLPMSPLTGGTGGETGGGTGGETGGGETGGGETGGGGSNPAPVVEAVDYVSRTIQGDQGQGGSSSFTISNNLSLEDQLSSNIYIVSDPYFFNSSTHEIRSPTLRYPQQGVDRMIKLQDPSGAVWTRWPYNGVDLAFQMPSFGVPAGSVVIFDSATH